MKRACRGSPVWLFAWALAACTPTLRQAVDYRGDQYAPRTPAARLPSVAVLPLGFESFGKLVARCSKAPVADAVDGAWLSDVDCSARRLRAALRDKASQVGAELLVGERCGSSSAARRGGPTGIRCQARAARADEPGRRSRPLAAQGRSAGARAIADADQAASLDDPTGEQAWRIEIRYESASRVAPRAPRPADAVGELPFLPVSHVALGLLESRCEAECTVDAVRAALRVAAGRLGASDVAGIRCVEHAPGITCMATAAQPEVDL